MSEIVSFIDSRVKFNKDTSKRKVDPRTGYLDITDNKLTRVGVFHYKASELGAVAKHLPPDKIVGVYRSPDEVFDEDALESFNNQVVTDDHPKEMVNADNSEKFTKGYAINKVRREGDYLVGDLRVTSKALIKKINSGKAQISNGYYSRLVPEEGVSHDGVAYSFKQTDIQGNHIAVVSKGRAGNMCALSDAALEIQDSSTDSVERDSKGNLIYRGEKFAGYNKPRKSSRKDKEGMVLVKSGNSVRVVHFGDPKLPNNQSKEANSNFYSRFEKTIKATKNDPTSPMYWSAKWLWPKGELTGKGAKPWVSLKDSEINNNEVIMDNLTYITDSGEEVSLDVSNVSEDTMKYINHLSAKVESLNTELTAVQDSNLGLDDNLKELSDANTELTTKVESYEATLNDSTAALEELKNKVTTLEAANTELEAIKDSMDERVEERMKLINKVGVFLKDYDHVGKSNREIKAAILQERSTSARNWVGEDEAILDACLEMLEEPKEVKVKSNITEALNKANKPVENKVPQQSYNTLMADLTAKKYNNR